MTPLKATESKSKFNEAQVEVQLGFASLNFNLTKIELETKSVKFNTNYR